MFYQPWNAQYKRMKPDWDRLANTIHPSVYIKDVDCSAEANLCLKDGVTTYPTIKYYLSGAEHRYEGGRSYSEMKSFVEFELAQKCTVSGLQMGCSEREKKYIKKMQELSIDDRTKEWKRLRKMAGDPMKPELQMWLQQRVLILEQMIPFQDQEL
mmetsp:Transcript_8536/g.13213  ORF Transcript_8536/g.13213 Transcript_8536/m.13213 type:complete len:155 (-) Transcript_8536:896-1360(-)